MWCALGAVCGVVRGALGAACVACQYAGDAAATSPAVPKCAWLSPRTARQSKDCLRVRVRRHASLRLRLARLAAAASPAQPIRSALSFGVVGLCGSLGSRSRIRRKTRHPSAVDGAERSVGIPPVALQRRLAAPAAPRRLTLAPPRAARHSLTLGLARSIREPRLRGGYAPPPASHFQSTGRVAAPRDRCTQPPRPRWDAALPVPTGERSAYMAREPVQAGRLRRNESGKRSACRADAREERGRSAIRRRDATGAAGTGGDWRREVSRPSQAHRSGGCMAHHGERRLRVGGATTEADARTQTCQRAPHRPLAERTDAKSAGTRNGRTRTQSNDCGGCGT